MHLQVVQQQEELLLYHMLLHVLLHIATVLLLLLVICWMCKDIQVRQQKEREVRRKDTRTLKQIAARLELDPPRSPLSDEATSEPETEEQQQDRYDTEFAEFLQRQQQQQAPGHPDTLPL